SVEEFQCLNRIEEGTYGVVYRAKDKKTAYSRTSRAHLLALRRGCMDRQRCQEVGVTCVRTWETQGCCQWSSVYTELHLMQPSPHLQLFLLEVQDTEVRQPPQGERETLLSPLVPRPCLGSQLAKGALSLRSNKGFISKHKSCFSSLIFLTSWFLNVGDFGLAREYGSPLKAYTPVVVTLWYRAPELLLGAKEYSTAIDMWSVGCIFGELLTQKPLFPGKSDIDQINKVFKDLGTPSEKIWPGYSDLPAVKKMTFTEYPYNNLRKRFGALLSDQGFDLMNKFLTYFPGRRINAEDGLKHEYFRETPLPIDPSMFPTWPAKSEQQRVKRGTSPRPPEGGLGYSQLGDDDLKETGFHLTTTNQGASAAAPGFSLKF
uniref:Protein kinase domain-containing protein n=1 Tax=Loxodonta africana TaxID=9785 RepID=G3TW51_LOXAF